MNNILVTGDSVGIGMRACADKGEISLSNGTMQFTIDRNGVKLGAGKGARLTNPHLIMKRLATVLGEPGEFKLATPACSLRICLDERVIVNDDVVGQDPAMLERATGFFMRVMGEALQSFSGTVNSLHESIVRAGRGVVS